MSKIDDVLAEAKARNVESRERGCKEQKIKVTIEVGDESPRVMEYETLFLVGILKDGLDDEANGAAMNVGVLGKSGGKYSLAIRQSADRLLREHHPIPSDILSLLGGGSNGMGGLGGLAMLADLFKDEKEDK